MLQRKLRPGQSSCPHPGTVALFGALTDPEQPVVLICRAGNRTDALAPQAPMRPHPAGSLARDPRRLGHPTNATDLINAKISTPGRRPSCSTAKGVTSARSSCWSAVLVATTRRPALGASIRSTRTFK
jgi:hypothetical protein